MKKILFILFLSMFSINAIFAQGRYREMSITGAGSYGTGLIGFDRLKNINEFSLIYSYWLNDTSTLDVSINYIMSEYKVDVFETGKPDTETTPGWESLSGTVGVRYQPDWDFFLDFGFGAGIGYEGWWVKSDVFEDRRGDGPVYYLLMDVEYPIREWLSVGVYVEPFYYPLNERLETSVDIDRSGNVDADYDKLKNSWIVVGGGWVRVRIY